MHKRLISVVMPVHNGLPYVIDAVQSILLQSCTDWELIIVDDGSKDGSYERLLEFAENYSRIRLVKHESNKGIAATYNTGIQNARGRFVAFQEQDDLSIHNRLETQSSIIEEYGIPFVTSRVAWLNKSDQIYKYWPNDISKEIEVLEPSHALYRQILIYQTCFANATTMIDRRTVSEVDMRLDERFKRSGQDWDLHLRLSMKYRAIRQKEPLVLMRRHSTHLSSTANKKQVFHDNRFLLRKHWKQHQEILQGREVNTFLRAWSQEFLLEARYYKGKRGLTLGLLSLLIWPLNLGSWISMSRVLRAFMCQS